MDPGDKPKRRVVKARVLTEDEYVEILREKERKEQEAADLKEKRKQERAEKKKQQEEKKRELAKKREEKKREQEKKRQQKRKRKCGKSAPVSSDSEEESYQSVKFLKEGTMVHLNPPLQKNREISVCQR